LFLKGRLSNLPPDLEFLAPKTFRAKNIAIASTKTLKNRQSAIQKKIFTGMAMVVGKMLSTIGALAQVILIQLGK
jgi:hypothetical protein